MNQKGLELINRAFLLANDLHRTQFRKHSIIPGGTPYISHLVEVAGMVLANGGDATTFAAALLHDAIEDQGVKTKPLIYQQCGDVVLRLVEECTEEGTGAGQKADWTFRKRMYLDHIPQASLPAILIMTADKLHNTRELQRKCYQEERIETISKFGGGYSGQSWFHGNLVRAITYRLAQFSEDDPMVIGCNALLYELNGICQYLFSGE